MESETRDASTRMNVRDQPPHRNWRGYWSRFWCFGVQKRGKQVVPSLQIDGPTSASREWAAVGVSQGVLSLAPPSSPASIVNSSMQSPVSFTLPLSVASQSVFSPGPAKLMFTIGPYAHETQLVSPPVLSTFTTEPSTASLTPPPELAHLTTPSSPDVPFAQLLASSLEAKSRTSKNASILSPLALASPGDGATGESKGSFPYQAFPAGQLISPPSGYSDSGTSSPFSDVDFTAQFAASSVFNSKVSLKNEIFRQRRATVFMDATLLKNDKQKERSCGSDVDDHYLVLKASDKLWQASSLHAESVSRNFELTKASETDNEVMINTESEVHTATAIPPFEEDLEPSNSATNDPHLYSSVKHLSQSIKPTLMPDNSLSTQLHPEFMTVHFDTGLEDVMKDPCDKAQESHQHDVDVQEEDQYGIFKAMKM